MAAREPEASPVIQQFDVRKLFESDPNDWCGQKQKIFKIDFPNKVLVAR
jgi:hypothetical protein